MPRVSRLASAQTIRQLVGETSMVTLTQSWLSHLTKTWTPRSCTTCATSAQLLRRNAPRASLSSKSKNLHSRKCPLTLFRCPSMTVPSRKNLKRSTRRTLISLLMEVTSKWSRSLASLRSRRAPLRVPFRIHA